MKNLLTLICIFSALTGCNSSKQITAVSETPIPRPSITETNKMTDFGSNFSFPQSTRENDSENSDDRQITYNNFEISNSEKGLAINKKGKRLLFIKNQNSNNKIQKGKFELKKLLGRDKQLIYQTWTGGNHCCVYFSVVDLSAAQPRVIFSSLDYKVQGNLDIYDGIGTFDKESDGKLEIAQELKVYVPSVLENCAWVSMPRIEVGFKYDETQKKYLPLKSLTSGQQVWNREYEQEIDEANKAIRSGKLPEMFSCEYKSIIVDIALSYIFAGNQKRGFDYLEKNFIAFEFETADTVRVNELKTKETIKELKIEIGSILANDKLFRAVYNR